MKKILITGANSYIGTSVENWLLREPDRYRVDTIDMQDGTWREKDFSRYDVVFHVAGIAHIKETRQNQDLYYKVNRDLAYETAQKSKREGVGQFIFLSSMSVYGLENGVIDKNTPLQPNTVYGKSKAQAEELIEKLSDDTFKVATLRPPIVYGKGCKGNYPRLAGLAMKTPFFPKVDNKRSMIYIDNLSAFVESVIAHELGGLFFPQNKEYVNTTELVSLVAKAHGKTVEITELLNYGVSLGVTFSETFKKVFGSLIYDKQMRGGPGTLINGNKFEYETCSFEESIVLTEKRIIRSDS